MSSSPLHRSDVYPPCLPGVEMIAIASARSFPRHSHDQFGIGLMRDGAHASWSGRGAVVAERGDVIAVNPNEIHDGVPIGESRSWDMIFLEPASVVQLVGPHLAGQEIGYAARRTPELASLVRWAFANLRSGKALAAEEALTELLSEVLAPRRHLSGDTHGGLPSRSVQVAIERIGDAPDTPPSLNEIADLMGLSRTAALRRFKREMGATPQDYAMQLRLRFARRALLAGEPIAAVAAASGFADQSHLTRAFSRQFGLPPGRWRRSAAPGNIVQDRDVEVR